MQTSRSILPILIIQLCMCPEICAQKTQVFEKGAVEVAILGTFHFGPTSDLASIKFDDIETEQRQSEILEVVERLSGYEPDKVLLEYPYESRAELQADYEAYLNGNYELRTNERDLIGFRLAEKLGHDSIYAIDHKLDLPFEPLVQYCQDSDKMDEFNSFVQEIQEFTARETERLTSMSLSAFLANMNTTEFDQLANDLYLRGTVNFGETGREVGVDAAIAWYKRNMYILKNIDRVTGSGDKVLLIVGHAHRAVLKNYIEDRSDMTFLEIGGYLRAR